MADQPTNDATPACPTCGGRRLVPRLYDSGRRHTRGAHIRAAALVPCPTCNAPKQLDERKPDA
jgi:endogenous inhibitor of DNA gyrase (YacG/DUF329 family)